MSLIRQTRATPGAKPGGPLGPPYSPFLSRLRRAVLDDFEPELILACKVAVLRAAGHRRTEIQRQLGVQPGELRAAERRVKRVAERMDHGD